MRFDVVTDALAFYLSSFGFVKVQFYAGGAVVLRGRGLGGLGLGDGEGAGGVGVGVKLASL